jgi:hypothetical protein
MNSNIYTHPQITLPTGIKVVVGTVRQISSSFYFEKYKKQLTAYRKARRGAAFIYLPLDLLPWKLT